MNVGFNNFDVIRIDFEDLLVHRDRVARLFEDVFVDGSRFDQLLSLIGRRRQHTGLAAVDSGQVFVPLQLLEQSLERVSGDVVLFVDLQDTLVVLHGTVELPEVVLPNLGCAEQQADGQLRVVGVGHAGEATFAVTIAPSMPAMVTAKSQ